MHPDQAALGGARLAVPGSPKTVASSNVGIDTSKFLEKRFGSQGGMLTFIKQVRNRCLVICAGPPKVLGPKLVAHFPNNPVPHAARVLSPHRPHARRKTTPCYPRSPRSLRTRRLHSNTRHNTFAHSRYISKRKCIRSLASLPLSKRKCVAHSLRSIHPPLLHSFDGCALLTRSTVLHGSGQAGPH